MPFSQKKIAEMPEADREAYVEELRTTYRKDIDILKLASELHVDEVVLPPNLRQSLIARYGLLASKSVSTPFRRRAVLPV